MGAIASQITNLAIVYSTVYSDTDQRKHQSSVSLAFVWGIHRGPVNSPHKWSLTRKMFPFGNVIMCQEDWVIIDDVPVRHQAITWSNTDLLSVGPFDSFSIRLLNAISSAVYLAKGRKLPSDL